MPKISVVIPVYNVENYIARCLDSIVNQTIEDIEIICVNDGSTDKSKEILENYQKNDTRIIIINQENKGLSATRNAGLDIAKGEYVSFIDSDDWVSSDFFEKLYDAAIRNNADIAAGEIVCVRRKKETTLVEYKQETVSDNFEEKLELCEIPVYCYVWNKIYRRTNLNVKFEEGRIYEDVIFTPIALQQSKRLVTVPGAKYYYFRHKSSIIKKKSEKSKQDYIYAQDKLKQFVTNCGLDISKYAPKVKKYKIYGLTVLKTIRNKKSKKYILLNCIKWRKK